MSEPLWTLDAMAAAMSATRAGALPRDVPGLSIDTRTIRPGEAFFAIQGENRDGHEFVEAALKAGAGLAVVAADKQAAMPQGRAAAGRAGRARGAERSRESLARAFVARSIVAVTGSVGKTGTKEALRLVLGRQGETHASAASYNNHWGVPLSLALMPQSTRFGVFEIGMNHAGEITPLTALVRPHVAIVTTIAPVHLEFFGTLDAIADAKAEIFSGVEPGGAAVINADIAQFERLARRSAGGRHRARSSRSASARAPTRGSSRSRCRPRPRPCRRASSATTSPTSSARRAGTWSTIRSACSPPRNCSAPTWRSRRSRSPTLKPPVGRGERVTLDVPGGTVLLIDESYNANPTSMRAALALLGQVPMKAARPAHRGARRHAGARARGRCDCMRGLPSRCTPTRSIWCSAPAR